MLSKKDQTKKKCRLRPKYSTKNKSKINDEEREYLEWLQHQPFKCFSCHTHFNIQYHHIKEHSTDKKIHTEMLPLCIECHTGSEFSAHGTPKQFRQRFSMTVQRVQAKQYYKMFLDR